MSDHNDQIILFQCYRKRDPVVVLAEIFDRLFDNIAAIVAEDPRNPAADPLCSRIDAVYQQIASAVPRTPAGRDARERVLEIGSN